MSWYKRSQLATKPQFKQPKPNEWGFDGLDFDPPRNEVKKDSPATKAVTLTLYRGFDVDMNKLQQGGMVLSPAKCEQGVMWFTHRLITGYDPIQYVTGRGSHLLTYPLQCKQHYQTVHYDDGSTYNEIPEAIQSQTNTMENCRFYQGYELPEGWYFSYKHEKFIVCTIPITVTPNMIKENVVTEE